MKGFIFTMFFLIGSNAFAKYDIIFSAGKAENGTNESNQRGCSRDHKQNCNLYRVSVDKIKNQVNFVNQVTDTSSSKGAWFPSIDPSGTNVIYEVYSLENAKKNCPVKSDDFLVKIS